MASWDATISSALAMFYGFFAAREARAAAEKAAELNYKIADRQIAMGEENWAIFKNNYLPCELDLAREVCAIPLYTPGYDTVIGRLRGPAQIQFDRAGREFEVTRSRYCVGATLEFTRHQAIALATTMVDVFTNGYRYEDAWKVTRDAERYKRRTDMANLGRQHRVEASVDFARASGLLTNLWSQAYAQQTDGVTAMGLGMRMFMDNQRGRYDMPSRRHPGYDTLGRGQFDSTGSYDNPYSDYYGQTLGMSRPVPIPDHFDTHVDDDPGWRTPINGSTARYSPGGWVQPWGAVF